MQPAFPLAALDHAQDRVGSDHPKAGLRRYVGNVPLIILRIRLQFVRLCREAVWRDEQPCSQVSHTLRILEVEIIGTNGKADTTERSVYDLDILRTAPVIEVLGQPVERVDFAMFQDYAASAVQDHSGIVNLLAI